MTMLLLSFLRMILMYIIKFTLNLLHFHIKKSIILERLNFLFEFVFQGLEILYVLLLCQQGLWLLATYSFISFLFFLLIMSIHFTRNYLRILAFLFVVIHSCCWCICHVKILFLIRNIYCYFLFLLILNFPLQFKFTIFIFINFLSSNIIYLY
jgi:hypothetical protein